MPPLAGGVVASQALSMRTHADGGPETTPLEPEYVFPALVNSLHAACFGVVLSKPQLVYLAFQASAKLNMRSMALAGKPSGKFHMVMSSSKPPLYWNILSAFVTLLTSQVDKPRGCAPFARMA